MAGFEPGHRMSLLQRRSVFRWRIAASRLLITGASLGVSRIAVALVGVASIAIRPLVAAVASIGITVFVRLAAVGALTRVWCGFRRAWLVAICFRVRLGAAVGATIIAETLMARSSVRQVCAHDTLAFGGKRLDPTGEAFRNLSTARLRPIAKPAIIRHANFHRIGELDRFQARRSKLRFMVEKASSNAPVARHDKRANTVIIEPAGGHNAIENFRRQIARRRHGC